MFILFVLLTPGTLINLSIGGKSAYSKWMVAAIHGFLFSVIAITTYSTVNDIYMGMFNSTEENFDINNIITGYIFSNPPGDKNFNTPSDIPPRKPNADTRSGPTIKCGKHNFCGSVDPGPLKKIYCYGDTNGCLWGVNDCRNDGDCKKYNDQSKKYTDYKFNQNAVCGAYSPDSWPGNICTLLGYDTKK
jgi:hypothetical protein